MSIKATQVLSDELLQDRLIETLIKDLISYAGANRGMLILTADLSPKIEAVGTVEDGTVRVSLCKCDLSNEKVPASIIYATMRKRKTIIVEDAMVDCPNSFKSDLRSRKAKSVICLPLLRQGSVSGLVYLENSVLPGVFSAERLPFLELLTNQAAVSLETAKLYARLVEVNHIRANIEAELTTSKAELAKASHSSVMGELSAAIAHEISQPLAAMETNAKASLNWLRMDPPQLEDAIASLEDISLDATRTSDLVQSLRSLARKATPKLLPISLDSIIREVCRLTSTEFSKSDVDLELVLQANTLVKADALQIRQVIYNLVNNALDAMRESSGIKRKLKISSFIAGGFAEIWVQDNGPGIAVEDLSSIFDPFFTTKATGMGMGLSICRSVVDAHAGTIRVENPEGGGCRMVLSFRITPN